LKLLSRTVLMACLLAAGNSKALADKKTTTVTVKTSFKWHAPMRTVRVTGYTQTKPYYKTGRMLALVNEDVSKYRFHYKHKTYTNDWGYFFKPGDKLSSRAIRRSFGTPTGYYTTLVVK